MTTPPAPRTAAVPYGLRDDKCWVHHDEDCTRCPRYWMHSRMAEAAAPAATPAPSGVGGSPGLDVAIGEHVRSRDFWHRCGETCAGDIAARLLRDKTP